MNNDLISRYALRKSVTDELERLHCVLYKYNEYFQATNKAFNTVLDFIDHAPTVDPEKVLIANVSFDEEKLKEIIQTEVINKIKNGELVLKAEEKPQGEREFIEILAQTVPEDLCTYPEYKGKPYYSIHYKENGEEFVGFGTYNPEVLSRYLRDYFMKGGAK